MCESQAPTIAPRFPEAVGQRTDRHTWLRALTDTPFRPHIYLTIAFTAVCVGVPGIRAVSHLVTDAHNATEHRQRGDIHLNAMRAMNTAVTHFLALLDDYLTAEPGRRPDRDDFASAASASIHRCGWRRRESTVRYSVIW